VLDRRLLFVSGKGGTGKSALTAAISETAARRGDRVLAIAMTDRIGLATHFGREDLDYGPGEVRPGLFALGMDRARALDEYLRIHLHVPRLAPTGPLSRALDALVETVPGIREIISIGKPIYEGWRREWDLVVVDAPPLGQLVSYLRAPRTIAGLVPPGRVRDQAAEMRATLEDAAETGLVLVATPEELPVAETAEALEEITREGLIDIVGVVANRVLGPLGASAERVAGVADCPQRAAASLHLGLHRSQRRWLAALPPGRRLPHLFGLHTPGEIAARLADELEGP
jgi:anion-transporting  ArsA/GET3 family ATPase